jgi:hypothetical protein
MARTTGNVKISIILALSIAILAAVLVTGTVVNIVSAANSINVQTKSSQHPVTSTASPHIVSSAAHGSIKVRPTGINPYDQCYTPTTNAKGEMTQIWGPCPSKIVDIKVGWDPSRPYTFTYQGKLLGGKGDIYTFQGAWTEWYGIDNARITFKVQEGKDKHAFYEPAATTTENQEGNNGGSFSGSFNLCDDPKYSDHIGYFTAYYAGSEQYAPSKYHGPYNPSQSNPWQLTLKVCNGPLPPPGSTTPTDFTGMHVQYYPSKGYEFPFSGKLEASVGGKKYGLNLAPLKYSFRYLDDTASHPRPFTPKKEKVSYIDYNTMADGTFSGSIHVCDDPKYNTTKYNQDAEFNVHLPGGNQPAFGPDVPYSNATSSNMSKSVHHRKDSTLFCHTRLPTNRGSVILGLLGDSAAEPTAAPAPLTATMVLRAVMIVTTISWSTPHLGLLIPHCEYDAGWY